MEIAHITPTMWLNQEEECNACLKQNYDLIPLLNVNSLEVLQEGRLVKFYGMVQDMFNPEYYFEKYEVVNEDSNQRQLQNGKYADILQCNEREIIDYESKNNITSERRTFVIISVPGLNNWVQNFEKEKFAVENKNGIEISTRSNKRSLDSDSQTNGSEQGPTNSSNKRSNLTSSLSTSNTNSTPVISQDHLLNFPLPGSVGKACHAKVYDTSDTIKLNDLVEIVGFLSTNSALINHSENCDNAMEIQTHHPPPSLIPRIHCVAWKKLEHNNCLVDGSTHNIESQQFWHLKKELHLVLTQLLLGDHLAAEYFLYHLISKVYMSNEMLALGKFSLNISHIPVLQLPEYGKQLYEFIEMLLPKSYYLPMTLENLNELVYCPKKDYECDRITSGILQLSKNTHLVLDETKLQAGQLNQSGVQAITSLAKTIKWQKVSYDFNYYPIEFDCDIPFLILSEGKSCLSSDCHVVLKPDELCINTFNEIVAAAKHFLKPNLLNNLRIYLTLARFTQYTIEDNKVSDLIENDFVCMRQEGTANAEDLHQLLVLARLICLSEGKATLDCDCWRAACKLETERKKRLL